MVQIYAEVDDDVSMRFWASIEIIYMLNVVELHLCQEVLSSTPWGLKLSLKRWRRFASFWFDVVVLQLGISDIFRTSLVRISLCPLKYLNNGGGAEPLHCVVEFRAKLCG